MARTISSPVWSGTAYTVLTEHGEEATWVNDRSGDGYPEPCNLYSYIRDYGMVGCKHPGMDITMPNGTPLYAIRAGVVSIRSSPNNDEVIVTDSLGERTQYNHVSQYVISSGNQVSVGQLIAYSGHSVSDHLHFEHRVPDSSTPTDWRIIDPEPVLTGGSTPPPPVEFEVEDLIRVADGPLNARTGPGTSYSIATSFATGVEMCITDGPTKVDGYTWYEIEQGTTTAWIAGEFCELVEAGGCSGTPPPPSGDFSVGDSIRVSDGPLNVRSGPGTSYSIVTSWSTGTEVCVISDPTDAGGYTWYETELDSTSGWIAGEFCELVEAGGCSGTPPPNPTYTHEVTGQTLNLRTCASASCGIIGGMPVGTKLQILEGPTTAEGYTWYRVDAEGFGVGWCVNGFDPI